MVRGDGRGAEGAARPGGRGEAAARRGAPARRLRGLQRGPRRGAKGDAPPRARDSAVHGGRPGPARRRAARDSGQGELPGLLTPRHGRHGGSVPRARAAALRQRVARVSRRGVRAGQRTDAPFRCRARAPRARRNGAARDRRLPGHHAGGGARATALVDGSLPRLRGARGGDGAAHASRHRVPSEELALRRAGRGRGLRGKQQHLAVGARRRPRVEPPHRPGPPPRSGGTAHRGIRRTVDGRDAAHGGLAGGLRVPRAAGVSAAAARRGGRRAVGARSRAARPAARGARGSEEDAQGRPRPRARGDGDGPREDVARRVRPRADVPRARALSAHALRGAPRGDPRAGGAHVRAHRTSAKRRVSRGTRARATT